MTMTVFVVQANRASNTRNGLPIGVYSDLHRAQEEADARALATFGECHTSSHVSERAEMRVYFVNGEPKGSHTIFRFELDAEVMLPDEAE
jgi:hypothetical protein